MGAIILVIFAIPFAIFCFYMAYKKYSSDQEEKAAYQKMVENAQQQEASALSKCLPIMEQKYNELRNTIKIPIDCEKIDVETTVFGFSYTAQAPVGKSYLLRNDFYCWQENDILYIFPTEEHITEKHITYANLPKDIEAKFNSEDIRIIKINRTEIQHYKLAGQERAETKVQSTNDGVNVKGAIVGGIIGGDAGAIIGSQHNKGRIYSYSEHFDERYVEIYYQQNGNTYKLKLSAKAYPLLEQWFPEKDYEYVVSANQTVVNTSDRFDEIKKYKELLDNGIISNEEFEIKKKELLNL